MSREQRATGRAGAPPRRFTLQFKFALGLVILSLVPLVVSAVLIAAISRLAHSFAAAETEILRPPLVSAKDAYRELVDTKKTLYGEVAERIARDVDLETATDDSLAAVVAAHPDVQSIVVRDATGVRASAGKAADAEPAFTTTTPLGAGRSLEVAFTIDDSLQAEYVGISRALERADRIQSMRSALPTGYLLAFIIVVGSVVVLMIVTGIVLARRITRRLDALVAVTREAAAGNLSTRVELRGRDELAELAGAFNQMLADLERDRAKISYLQRVGAWQDVARKLAHEIKNPLTPIQLAVQQCVSAYDGDDPRYRKLLGDAQEIVAEEISSLRRLVDAFRTLGQLPKVAPEPLDLATVVDDLRKDPRLADALTLVAPEAPVSIRGDRLLLRRVLANLVENGIQAGIAAGKPGAVVVGWRAADGNALVTIDDEGPGVPEDARERIFEPYVTSKEDGTGLGLTICKKIAIEHGGTLAVDDAPAPTGGARFILILPGDGLSKVTNRLGSAWIR